MSSWPHKFTKDGPERQIGEEKITDNYSQPVLAQPMICVCCSKKFVKGVDPYPVDMCPARTDAKELKRIKNVTG